MTTLSSREDLPSIYIYSLAFESGQLRALILYNPADQALDLDAYQLVDRSASSCQPIELRGDLTPDDFYRLDFETKAGLPSQASLPTLELKQGQVTVDAFNARDALSAYQGTGSLIRRPKKQSRAGNEWLIYPLLVAEAKGPEDQARTSQQQLSVAHLHQAIEGYQDQAAAVIGRISQVYNLGHTTYFHLVQADLMNTDAQEVPEEVVVYTGGDSFWPDHYRRAIRPGNLVCVTGKVGIFYKDKDRFTQDPVGDPLIQLNARDDLGGQVDLLMDRHVLSFLAGSLAQENRSRENILDLNQALKKSQDRVEALESQLKNLQQAELIAEIDWPLPSAPSHTPQAGHTKSEDPGQDNHLLKSLGMDLRDGEN